MKINIKLTLLYTLKVLWLIVVPGILFYFGSDDVLNEFCQENGIKFSKQEEVSSYKWMMYMIGIVISAVGTAFYYIKENQGYEKVEKYHELFKMTLITLREIFSANTGLNGHLNVRVFKVKRCNPVSDKVMHIVNFKIRFVTDEILGKNRLKFRYINRAENKIIEGLVGLCYDTGEFVADYHTGDAKKYTLTKEQKAIIGNVSLCCAAPIFKDDKIKYIISIDAANTKLDESHNEFIKTWLKHLSTVFDEYIL